MAKQTITQRSFIIGEPREEFLEADDLDLRLASLRMARNVRIKATRTIDQKLGSIYKREIAADYPIFEIRPNFGEESWRAADSGVQYPTTPPCTDDAFEVESRAG